jgi:glutamine synthetase
MTFRLVVKEVALEQGVYASFMPKPFTEHPGSGMHTHLSLFEGDRNAFYEPARPTSSQGRAEPSSPVCSGTPPRSRP